MQVYEMNTNKHRAEAKGTKKVLMDTNSNHWGHTDCESAPNIRSVKTRYSRHR